jgi:predicted nucleic-acid-binding Zn-ribbon protein
MPIHVPAPTEPTDRCPKCGSQGVAQQSVANMTAYACPKCGARWMSANAPPKPARRM